jgi:hypothetical protein
MGTCGTRGFPRPDLKARETLQQWLGTHGVTLAADKIDQANRWTTT